MIDKKGLSTIIVTLILIVISLAAIGVFWLIVRNIIQGGSEQIGIERFMVDAEVKNVQVESTANNITLTFKRKSGEGDLTGVKFVFTDDSSAEIMTENFDLKPLEERRYHFHLDRLNVSNILTITIIPLIVNDKGKEILGNSLGTYTLKKGSYSTNVSNQTCTPTTCASLGFNCGSVPNGSCIGPLLDCGGTCSSGYTCVSNICQATCTPTTCSALGASCGNPQNGTCSGSTLSCGDCSTGYECVSGTCQVGACTPTTCSAFGYTCGTWSNGTCGGTLACGSCSTGYTCVSGSCVMTCTPTTCSALGYNCGTHANGTCGGTLACGSCSSGYACVSGVCTSSCAPTTCSALGYNCGTWSNGTCAGTLSCGSCSSGYTCNSGVCTATPSGLVALYHFDRNTGVGESDSLVYDWSGNGNNGTAFNGAAYTSSGRTNGGYIFDGINDYISVVNSASLNPNYITISAWVSPREVNTNDTYIIYKSSSYFIDATRSFANRPHFYCYNSSTYSETTSSSIALTANTWNHVAASFNGTTTVIYLNGVQTGLSSLIGVINPAATNLFIGNNAWSSGGFNGTIDEVRIYNRVLSASEVASLYASG